MNLHDFANNSATRCLTISGSAIEMAECSDTVSDNQSFTFTRVPTCDTDTLSASGDMIIIQLKIAESQAGIL